MLKAFNATVGESDLQGHGTFTIGESPHFDLDLSSKSLYLPLFRPDLIEEKDEETTVTAETSIFSNTELPSAWMDLADGRLTYTVDKIWTTPRYATGLQTEFTLESGELITQSFTWKG